MKANLLSTKVLSLLILSSILLFMNSCEDDEDEEPIIETRIIDRPILIDKLTPTYPVVINMKQKVRGVDLQLNTTNKPYTNALNQNFNVTRLRYLISDLTFHMSDGNSFIIDGYHFVDVADSTTLTYTPTDSIPEGTYTMISFKFGFDRIDNAKSYPDLTAVSWGWPAGVGGTPNLGGGWHFMQLEGNYDGTITDDRYLTHMGTARSIVGTDTTFEDNHFVAYPSINPIRVDSAFSFDIVMNVEEWFENPFSWDFNVYNRPIMPNYNAQRKLFLNGPSVFTIE